VRFAVFAVVGVEKAQLFVMWRVGHHVSSFPLDQTTLERAKPRAEELRPVVMTFTYSCLCLCFFLIFFFEPMAPLQPATALQHLQHVHPELLLGPVHCHSQDQIRSDYYYRSCVVTAAVACATKAHCRLRLGCRLQFSSRRSAEGIVVGTAKRQLKQNALEGTVVKKTRGQPSPKNRSRRR